MPSIECGASILYPEFEQGTSGCLLRFTDAPQRALLMTAGHVVLPSYARQSDPIYATDIPNTPIGVLRTWTSFEDVPTADAAFIWVDPRLIVPRITSLGAPTAFNMTPQIGDVLRILPITGQLTPRETTIREIGNVEMLMPGWKETINYRNQLLCEPMVTSGGDSGAAVLDARNQLVGMVVGGWDALDRTIVTPISAILNNSAWGGAKLELLSTMPSDVIAPPLPPAPVQNGTTTPAAAPVSGPSLPFGSLVSNGFFSNNANDHSVPRSIRTNNPGALNFTTWQKSRPGFVGKTEPDGSVNKNVTTIYRTPEHGVASWFHLLATRYGFGSSGPFTVAVLAQHYAGQQSGPSVDNYIAGWRHASGDRLTAQSAIDLTVDQQVLGLARAMFTHEAGRPSPLHDDQIEFGFQQERAGGLPP